VDAILVTVLVTVQQSGQERPSTVAFQLA